jgi:hypothetical protein
MGDSNMTPKAAHKEDFSLKTICAALNIVILKHSLSTAGMDGPTCRRLS